MATILFYGTHGPDEDLKGKNATWGNPKMFAEAVVAADKVVGF